MSDQNTDNKNQNETVDEAATQSVDMTLLLEKAKNDFLYLKAEFENYKRNSIKERSEIIKYGAERVLVDILNVVDNFDRALETSVAATNLDVFRKGVELTASELKSALKKHGISEVESFGKAFDPALHEAIGTEPTEEVESGKISRVLKKPYKLHDKVIRPGQVIIATHSVKIDS